MTRERRGGEGSVIQTEAGAKPAPAKASARAARGGKAQVSEKLDDKEPASRNEANAQSSQTRPDRQAASSDSAGVPPTRARRERPAGGRGVSGKAPASRAAEPQLEALTEELRAVKTMVQRLVPPPLTDTSTADTILEGAVNSLRRLLSELIEERMEALVRDLAQVRSDATSAAADEGGRIVARLDQLLESLGARKFEARRFDAIDPLIHVAVEERREQGIPEGVVLATVRPGFRSGRGVVVCKAAVAVNRGA